MTWADTCTVPAQRVTIDVEIGEPEEYTQGIPAPVLIILNEGFDGLRILVYNCFSLDEAEELIEEGASYKVKRRFRECNEGRGFHYFGWAQRWGK